jgi:hypothetical protein
MNIFFLNLQDLDLMKVDPKSFPWCNIKDCIKCKNTHSQHVPIQVGHSASTLPAPHIHRISLQNVKPTLILSMNQPESFYQSGKTPFESRILVFPQLEHSSELQFHFSTNLTNAPPASWAVPYLLAFPRVYPRSKDNPDSWPSMHAELDSLFKCRQH